MPKIYTILSLPAAGIFLLCAAGPAYPGGEVNPEYIALECTAPGLCRAKEVEPPLSGFKPELLILNGRLPKNDPCASSGILPPETAALVKKNNPVSYRVKNNCLTPPLSLPPSFSTDSPEIRMDSILLNHKASGGTPEGFLRSPRIILLFSHLTAGAREKTLPQDKVIRALRIRPGMDIVDIGAGKGFFSFLLAEAVQPDGKIFATDINPWVLQCLSREAESKKINNILPVVVKADGFDPFYGKHVFDIIFICEVARLLSAEDSKDYFGRLLHSLKKDTGRLYILDLKDTPADTEILKRMMSSWDYSSPLFNRMRPDNRDFLRKWDGGRLPEKRARDIAADLNGVIRDVSFAKDTAAYLTDGGKTPLFFLDIIHKREVILIKCLLPRLYKARVFETEYAGLPPRQKQQITALNKTLMKLLLRIEINDLLPKRKSSSSPMKKADVISLLCGCGYELVNEHTFLPEHYFLEFRRKK